MRVIPKHRNFPQVPSLFSFLISSALGLLLVASGHAQITLDGTLGPKGPLSGPHYVIGARLGQIKGANLFHSFEDFNIWKGESARFTGPDYIEHVIARVTGGDPSNIFGRLKCTIDGADLFLINPYGVIFGEDAQLDVKGSFYVSTADELRFSDGTIFSARGSEPTSVLSSAKPEAFGFLTDHPAPIIAENCTLTVPKGETLQLVGGDITLRHASLNAESGHIDLVSTASEGWVSLEDPLSGMDAFDDLGNINISQGSSIDTSGEGGGRVRIVGGEVAMDHVRVSAETWGEEDGEGIYLHARKSAKLNAASISTATLGAGGAGEIRFEGGSLSLSRGSLFSTSGLEGSTGEAGKIGIVARELAMDGNSGLESASYGEGNGGAITIRVDDALGMQGGSWINCGSTNGGDAGSLLISSPEASMTMKGGANITANAEQGGEGGSIDIQVGDLELNKSYILSYALGGGDGGDITIHAGGDVVLRNQSSIATKSRESRRNEEGRTGDIYIDSASLILCEQSYLSTKSRNAGRGGDINIRARKSVFLTDVDTTIETGSELGGISGDIHIQAPTITLENEASLSASCERRSLDSARAGNIVLEGDNLYLRGGSYIVSMADGQGDAGNITIRLAKSMSMSGGSNLSTGAKLDAEGDAGDIFIDAESIKLTNESYIQNDTYGAGMGGEIRIATSRMTLTDFSYISALSDDGTGDAGNIKITARGDGPSQLLLRGGSYIETGANTTNGGNIDIHGFDYILLQDSWLSASVWGKDEAPGSGGNITINGRFMIMNNSHLLAFANEGNGGNISIFAEAFIKDWTSTIDASSELGIDGQVQIDGLVDNLAVVQNPLPKDFVSAPDLLREACERRYREKKQGSLLVKGRDGLPFEPERPLPSPLP